MSLCYNRTLCFRHKLTTSVHCSRLGLLFSAVLQNGLTQMGREPHNVSLITSFAGGVCNMLLISYSFKINIKTEKITTRKTKITNSSSCLRLMLEYVWNLVPVGQCIVNIGTRRKLSVQLHS